MYCKYQGGQQLQLQLSKQKLAQLQCQNDVCETLFLTLASAEKVALGLSDLKEYKAYDTFNSASFKNKEELENELAVKLIFLNSSFIAYERQHGQFMFPDEVSKNEIMQDINKWESQLGNRSTARQSFETLKKIINRTTIYVPESCFNPRQAQFDNGKFVNTLMENINLVHDMNRQEEDVKQQYEKTGNYHVQFKKERKRKEDFC